jgi:tRNA A-37 threonylcarbamoyl transferase component Bud32
VEPDDGDRGNRLLLVGEGRDARVVKIFRRRCSALRELLGEMAARIVHRKRGVDVRSRYETELRSVEIWAQNSFDVPATFDLPPPPGADGPAIWYEYVAGPRLSDVLADEGVARETKEDLLRRFASQMDRRHALALERREPLLVHEDGAVKHVLVCGDRMVTFDFEGGYGPRFCLEEAMADEVSAALHSIAKATGDLFADALTVFAESYGNRERLRRIAGRAVSGMRVRRLFKRFADRLRRGRDSGKVALMRRLQTLLERWS